MLKIYGKNIFSKKDYAFLADIFKNLKEKFILSLNDTQFIRETFKDFQLQEISALYTVGRSGNNKAAELIITK